MKTEKQKLGAMGENLAANYYCDNGGLLIDRNVRYPCGEIDLIVKDSEEAIIFVEVKTRSSTDFGAAEAVTQAKISHLRRAAAQWLSNKHVSNIRFDVVVVIVNRRTGATELSCYPGVEHGAR